MKRTIIVIVLLIICCLVVSCDNGESSGKQRSKSEETSENNGKKKENAATPTLNPTNTPTPTPQAHYFGNRTTQYDETNSRHQVFWSFSETEDGENIRQDATIHIVITNDNGEQVYKGDHKVTSANYSMWNSTLMGTRLLGCIYIKDSEISQGTTQKGVLTISAELSSGTYWDESKIQISNLPVKPLQLSLPTVPITLTEYKYNGKVATKIEIQEISYENDWRLSYKLTVKMTQNTKGNDSSDYCHITYKLKNSKGIIVDSGMWSIGRMSVGDTIISTEYISVDIDLNESYVLELLDYKP